MNEKNKDVRKSVTKNENKALKEAASAASGASTAKSDGPLKPEKTLLDTGADLKRALDAWNDLAAQAPAPSADEKLLHDVQNLLKQLKSKIEEFK